MGGRYLMYTKVSEERDRLVFLRLITDYELVSCTSILEILVQVPLNSL